MKTGVADLSVALSDPESPVKGAAGNFTAEADGVDKATWYDLFRNFADANIYQTWPYGVAKSGPAGVSHLVIRRGSETIAAAQVRLARVPGLNLGMAYVFWGPLWRHSADETDLESFRQALRALKSEYVGRRRLVLRIVPNLSDTEPVQRIFEQEGFLPQPLARRRRTIVMDIRPSMEDLYQGLHQKWRYNLKKARKRKLEIVEGEGDALFEAFERIHAEMRERKQLTGLTNPALCRSIQKELMPDQRLRVILCQADNEVCAGGICSALGDTGIYLLGATSNHGTKTYASYLVHWKMLEWVKSRGCQFYDLNGINPTTNPGGYQFKFQLGGAFGRDVHLPGGFDAYPGAGMKMLVPMADRFLASLWGGREILARLLGKD